MLCKPERRKQQCCKMIGDFSYVPAVRQVTSPEQLVDAAPAPAADGKQEARNTGSDGDRAAPPGSPSRRLLRYRDWH